MYTVAAVVSLILAGWLAWTQFGPAPASAPATASAPAEEIARQAVAEAEAERLARERDVVRLETERLAAERAQLEAERARLAAERTRPPPAASVAGIWDGTLPSGTYVWTLQRDGTFFTPTSNGRWYQNGNAVTLRYQRPDGWRTELTLSGNRMSGYEYRPDGSRGSYMDARRR